MHSIIFSVIIAITACFSSLQGQEEIGNRTKIYIESSNIYINDKGLFLVFDSELIPVECISKDDAGLYAIGNEMAWGNWVCPSCHRINSVADRSCPSCDRGR